MSIKCYFKASTPCLDVDGARMFSDDPCGFQVDRQSLCKNIIRAISSSANPQPFDSYPIGHRVTWRYYMGLLAFLEEDYVKVRIFISSSSLMSFCLLMRGHQAEDNLLFAFQNCHHQATRNLSCVISFHAQDPHLLTLRSSQPNPPLPPPPPPPSRSAPLTPTPRPLPIPRISVRTLPSGNSHGRPSSV